MEPVEIYKNTYCFDEGHVRFFLIVGEKRALLIDSGMKTENARELVEKITDKEIVLVNTHADMDHTACNAQFEIAHMHPCECYNYKGKIAPVWDDDYFDLGNRAIEVIHIPGHTPGSIALLDRENKVLFSGDPIQEEGNIFMFGPTRNMNAYILSMERLEGMDSFDTIYPSHGKYPLLKKAITDCKNGCIQILNGEIKGQERDMFGHKIKAYDIGTTIILCD